MVQAAAHPDAHIIFGASIAEDVDDEIRVVVIATGFDAPPTPKQQQSAIFSNARKAASTFSAPAQTFTAPAPTAPQQSQAEASVADGRPVEADDPFADIMKIFSSK